LNAGWNLISIPTSSLNNSRENLFGEMSVYGYNGSWFIPEQIDSQGYWVKSGNNIVIEVVGHPMVPVSPDGGWNIMGHPYLTQKNVQELFDNVTVYSYNGSWSSFDSNRERNSLEVLKPGYGYWVREN
jgi:hypothetical protein